MYSAAPQRPVPSARILLTAEGVPDPGELRQIWGLRRSPLRMRSIKYRLVPKSHKDMVAAVFRTIFAQPDPATVAATWDTVRDQLAAAFRQDRAADG